MQTRVDGDESRSREIYKCIYIALLCVQENPADRPSMNSIIAMLTTNTDLNQLPVPSQPRVFEYSTASGAVHKSFASDHTDSKTNAADSNCSAKSSINEASITLPYPR